MMPVNSETTPETDIAGTLSQNTGSQIMHRKLADVMQATPDWYNLASHSQAQAIIAALPDMVKPLQWGEVQWGQDEFGCQQWGEFIDNLTSMSVCECYAIYRFGDGKFMWTQGDHDNMRFSTYRPLSDPDWVPEIPWHPTEEAAKAAAQDHHAAQVLSAFGITPPDAGREG